MQLRHTLWLFLLLTSYAEAGGLTTTYDLEDTALLPRGVISPRLKSIYGDVTEKYNSEGHLQGLAKSINRPVKWKEVLPLKKGQEREMLEASLKAQGMDLNSTGPGNLTGQVNVSSSVSVPVLAYGVTNRFNLAIAIPIYNVKTEVKTGFVPSKEGKNWYKSMAVPSDKASAKNLLDNGVQTLASYYQYSPVQSEEFTALGDIKIIGKYLIAQIGDNRFVFNGSVNLPTGKKPDNNKLIDVPTGDGQWDLGMLFVWDHGRHYSSIGTDLQVESHVGYTYQAPDILERRIPYAEGDLATTDKELVRRDLGDQARIGGSVVIGDTRNGSSLGIGYDYQYMMPTKYSGSDFSSDRYTFMENSDEDASLQSIVFVYSYSTIDKYRRKDFFMPLTLNLSYANPLAGKNVNATRTYNAEMVFYF